jgi:hypothetical protein
MSCNFNSQHSERRPHMRHPIVFVAVIVILCVIFTVTSINNGQQLTPYSFGFAVGQTVKHAFVNLWLFYMIYKAILRL